VNRKALSARGLLLAILIPLMVFVSLVSWAFASPVAATPDEDFHLASIWCGLGERQGLCEDPGDGSVHRRVPTSLVSATCYAFHPNESAACWDPDQPGMTLVKRANADGLYPPVFYAVMSVFASRDIPASVMAMRLFNSLFAVALLTTVFWVLPRWMRPALVVSVAATAVPLGYFVLSSVNPSSWAVLSGATVWIALYGATQTSGRRRIALAVLAVFGAFIGAGARADSAIYAVFGVVIALLLGVRFKKANLIPLLAGAIIVAIGLAFYFSAAQGSAVVDGLAGGKSSLSGGQVISNLLEIPSLWVGALGGWPLGWIDTNLHSVVQVLSTFVFAGALFVGITRARGRRALAVVLALAAMWAVPFILLYQSRTTVGDLVQPRYILPLMVIAIGVASLRRDADRSWAGMRLWLAGGALTIAFTVALHTNIQRYTTGANHLSLDPGAGAKWWWSDVPSPLVIWAAGTIAFVAVIVLLRLVLPRGEREASTASGALGTGPVMGTSQGVDARPDRPAESPVDDSVVTAASETSQH
jgi:hypothetical protein